MSVQQFICVRTFRAVTKKLNSIQNSGCHDNHACCILLLVNESIPNLHVNTVFVLTHSARQFRAVTKPMRQISGHGSLNHLL